MGRQAVFLGVISSLKVGSNLLRLLIQKPKEIVLDILGSSRALEALGFLDFHKGVASSVTCQHPGLA